MSIICSPGFVKQHIDGEERAGYFTLIVFLVDCDCYCSVALPHGAMGLSAMCDHTHLLFVSLQYSIAIISMHSWLYVCYFLYDNRSF